MDQDRMDRIVFDLSPDEIDHFLALVAALERAGWADPVVSGAWRQRVAAWRRANVQGSATRPE
jgi:hypothetical protein